MSIYACVCMYASMYVYLRDMCVYSDLLKFVTSV